MNTRDRRQILKVWCFQPSYHPSDIRITRRRLFFIPSHTQATSFSPVRLLTSNNAKTFSPTNSSTFPNGTLRTALPFHADHIHYLTHQRHCPYGTRAFLCTTILVTPSPFFLSLTILPPAFYPKKPKTWQIKHENRNKGT